jgi:hypothetical protein
MGSERISSVPTEWISCEIDNVNYCYFYYYLRAASIGLHVTL